MSKISRRGFITAGVTATAGVSAVAVAAKVAGHYGLVPPNCHGVYGAGETLTYATQRVLTRHTTAREFPRGDISQKPFANSVDPLPGNFKTLQQGGFKDWRLVVDGLAAKPASFSVEDLKSFPTDTQITEIACEEGWSYIAEWKGVKLSYLLDRVAARPEVRYVAYKSIQPDWTETIDMADASHPQTLVAYGMNDAELPVPFGGPLRMRVPRQLGYKSVKYITHIILADNLKQFDTSEGGYQWYAGM